MAWSQEAAQAGGQRQVTWEEHAKGVKALEAQRIRPSGARTGDAKTEPVPPERRQHQLGRGPVRPRREPLTH